jgi:cytoskeleton protein RodZ
METIGSYLKSVRESKGIRLQDVSDRTKIKMHFLTSIESDQLSQVGEFGYARAMMVSVARDIGADVRKVCEMYDRKYDHEVPDMYTPVSTSTVRHRFMLSHRMIYTTLVLVLLLVLAAVVWRMYANGLLTLPHNFLKAEIDNKAPTEKAKPMEAQPEPTSAPAPAPASASTSVASTAPDTTDHVNNLLFKGKASPMNYRDH